MASSLGYGYHCSVHFGLRILTVDPTDDRFCFALSSVHPGSRTNRTLRLPRFLKLKSVTMCVPGPYWSDLIYEITSWFARSECCEEIAGPACRSGRASSLFTPSLPSTNPATSAVGWKRTRIKFCYSVGKGDVDWRKLESAALGEDFEGYDCSAFGNHGGGAECESGLGGGNGNDHVQVLMEINPGVENRGAGGRQGARFTTGSLWVEVGGGSGVFGEIRRKLGRLDRLGLLQVSCR